MGGRIERGYRRRFRDLLALVQPRRLEFGVELLMTRGREKSTNEGLPLVRALGEVYDFTRRRVENRLRVTGACTLVRAPWERFRASTPRFLCDPSLGGLARWLRASGYEAEPSTSAPRALLDEAESKRRVLLTSRAALVESAPVTSGRVAALWIASTLTAAEQLRMTLRDLGLPLREPRCMTCGGAMAPVAKKDVAPRIPPRTAQWRDDYWVCGDCGQLYWQGTHWERIARTLVASA